jgi:sulfopyruvate decarboxylase subunit beta
VDFVSSLPCEKVKGLLLKAGRVGVHVPLTREEEGVGISAGAALAGRRPAMVVQSSGIGNMLNALLSLTGFYGLPLALFISRRGIYKEAIAAQIPMGRALPALLRAAGIPFLAVKDRRELAGVRKPLNAVYERGMIHAFLLSPAIWEGCEIAEGVPATEKVGSRRPSVTESVSRGARTLLERSEIIRLLAPCLKGNIVVSNLGFPSKELYNVLDQPSNFYMLGSMGMATPVGLGIALNTKKKVFVIDGDGSILMNPGTLATAALVRPWNLTVLAIDNGVYGSTGNQPTPTRYGTDLAAVARGFGIRNVIAASSGREIMSACLSRGRGPRFVHILARPGNAQLANIPLRPEEIRKRVMEAIRG